MGISELNYSSYVRGYVVRQNIQNQDHLGQNLDLTSLIEFIKSAKLMYLWGPYLQNMLSNLCTNKFENGFRPDLARIQMSLRVIQIFLEQEIFSPSDLIESAMRFCDCKEMLLLIAQTLNDYDTTKLTAYAETLKDNPCTVSLDSLTPSQQKTRRRAANGNFRLWKRV